MSLLDNLIGGQNKRLEVGSSETGITKTTIGLATSDSKDGIVNVVLPGAVIAAETISGAKGDGSVPLPCINPCKKDDSVYVSLTGNDTIKTPYVIGPVGSGDRMNAAIDEAKTIGTTAEETARVAKEAAEAAETAAAEAYDAVEATNQFFWHDSQGAHIATQENDATAGPNLLLNSNGVIQRDGTNYLSTQTASGFTVYDGQGNTPDNVRATFGDTTVIGKATSSQLVMDDDSIDITSIVSNQSETMIHLGSDYQTIGQRSSGSTIGDQSVAVGTGNTAGDFQSAAFGYANTVSSRRGHAFGGNNTVTGRIAGAFGIDNEVAGLASFAFGVGLVSNTANQTIVGSYNTADANKAFIIGGGSSNDSRSNVLGIDYSGNIEGKYGDVLQHKVLWSGTTQSSWAGSGSHSITLSDNAANYKYVDLEFQTSDGTWGSTRVSTQNVSSVVVALSNGFVWTGSYTGGSVKSMSVQISGTTVSLWNNGNGNCRGQIVCDSAGTRVEAGNYIYLRKVIGYR